MRKTKKIEENIFFEEINSKIKDFNLINPILKFKLTKFLNKLKESNLNFHLLFLELREIEGLNPMFSEREKQILLKTRKFLKKVNDHYAKLNPRTKKYSLR